MTAPLTLAERVHLIRRLVADGIVEEDVATGLVENAAYDIPVVLCDREILDLYARVDKRAAELVSLRPIVIQMPAPPRRSWFRRG